VTSVRTPGPRGYCFSIGKASGWTFVKLDFGPQDGGPFSYRVTAKVDGLHNYLSEWEVENMSGRSYHNIACMLLAHCQAETLSLADTESDVESDEEGDAESGHCPWQT
jgi:hypothetical protein